MRSSNAEQLHRRALAAEIARFRLTTRKRKRWRQRVRELIAKHPGKTVAWIVRQCRALADRGQDEVIALYRDAPWTGEADDYPCQGASCI
jgi:hypothetical protein